MYDMMLGLAELELLVAQDMVENGYDPLNKDDVERYWKEHLDGN